MPDPDSLLHVLTARGRVGFPALREISSELDASESASREPDTLRTYKLARYLDMLGHVEFLQKGSSSAVAIAPACLARLPLVERHLYVLCGARSAAASEEIAAFRLNGRKTAQVSLSSRKNYPDPLIPTRIVAEFEDDEKARLTAEGLSIGAATVSPAWSLASMSASCEDFENSLAWRARTLKDEELKFYDAERFSFEFRSRDAEGLALRADDPSFACIVRGEKEAVVSSLNWGRCWAHAEAGTSCFRYDRNRGLFAAPARLPLPRLLARALCLCSGLPAAQAKLKIGFASGQWLVFQDVPKEIALKVTEKLGLPAAPASLTDFQ